MCSEKSPVRGTKKLTHTLTLFGLVGLSGCEKSEFCQDLTGTWEIFGSGGAIAGQGVSYDFLLCPNVLFGQIIKYF
jgi:hypothetical protein